jgi:RHS repeat-associated protein
VFHHEKLVSPALSAPSDDASSTNRFLFTGHMWDAETGLYYAKARYYDPQTGRFTTQDSYLGELLDPPSLHRYMYAHNNPTRFVDPSGHSDADANRLAAAMHKRTGFLASDHRPADQRGWWYNFGQELYSDLPPRLLPMGHLEGMVQQDAEKLATGIGETVVAAVLPPAVRKGAQAAVARVPKLGEPVGKVAGELVERLRGRAPTLPPPDVPAKSIAAVPFVETQGRGGAFVVTEDGMVPLRTAVRGGSQGNTANALRVTPKGIDRIERHLSRPELAGAIDDPANAAMIERLKSGETTPQDLRFYSHELRESVLMDRGVAAREAHLQTLKWQGVPYKPGYEAELYHPDIILKDPSSFSSAAVRAAEAAAKAKR